MSDNKNTKNEQTSSQQSSTKNSNATTPQQSSNLASTVTATSNNSNSLNNVEKNNTKKTITINAKLLRNIPGNAFPVIENLKKIVDEIKVSGSDAQIALVNSFENYIEKMKPGLTIDGKDGAINQYRLWLAIKRILEVDPKSEFKGLWILALAYVRENLNGVFAPQYCYRFTKSWTRSQTELNGLNSILNLMITTYDLSKRTQVHKQVNIDYAMSQGFNDEARSRIWGFYNN